jgi:hydroxyacylglutathione hydrolase
MPRIPIEDNFNDVINKAQRGSEDQRRGPRQARPKSASADLAAVKGGKVIIPAIRRVARHLRLGPERPRGAGQQDVVSHQPNFPRGFAMFNTPSRT